MEKEMTPVVLKCGRETGKRLRLEVVINLDGKNNADENRRRKDLSVYDWLEHHRRRQCELGRKSIRQITGMMRITAACGGKDVMLKDADADFCKKLIEYMRNEYLTAYGRPLRPYTQINYLRCFCHALNEAMREGMIDNNPMYRLRTEDKIKKPDRLLKYLTIEEIRKLINTDCRQYDVKRAFLFACFCGLRISDVMALTWENVKNDGNGKYRLELMVKKTGRPLTIYLSEEAYKWLPRRTGLSAKVFQLPSAVWTNKTLKSFGVNAGISKRLTFHVARHTFATMMLTLGADLYTTSKLLGHANIKTTQIYAQIVDKKKEEAVNLVNGLF